METDGVLQSEQPINTDATQNRGTCEEVVNSTNKRQKEHYWHFR